jgi:micrococcal nuclease
VRLRLLLVYLLAIILASGCGGEGGAGPGTETVARVVDGDTIDLADGERVRLVQIDTPEVYGEPECFGAEASAEAQRLLPPGTTVRLEAEPATDDVDDSGRLLRYVIRGRDDLNVNVRLVERGAAAPYFFEGRRGRYADELERLARAAREDGRDLWGRCPGTPYEPDRGVATGPA